MANRSPTEAATIKPRMPPSEPSVDEPTEVGLEPRASGQPPDDEVPTPRFCVGALPVTGEPELDGIDYTFRETSARWRDVHAYDFRRDGEVVFAWFTIPPPDHDRSYVAIPDGWRVVWEDDTASILRRGERYRVVALALGRHLVDSAENELESRAEAEGLLRLVRSIRPAFAPLEVNTTVVDEQVEVRGPDGRLVCTVPIPPWVEHDR